jgi:sulfate transport system substrate-binding protein
MFSPVLRAFGILVFALLGCEPGTPPPVKLLHVSYDPTRELYAEFNQAFSQEYFRTSGRTVEIFQSHGSSGKQARAILEGLDADIASLALAYDIDVLAKRGKLLDTAWAAERPQNSVPYFSTIVFLVRPGNPKSIHDWQDLVKPGVTVITANPKTSGGARWNHLAAYGQAYLRSGRDSAFAMDYMRQLYSRVPVLDASARGSSTTFAQRGIGDICLAWENEAQLAVERLGHDRVEIVIPPLSILAEPPVASVRANAHRHGTEATVEAYLSFLYVHEGQIIAAKHGYRVHDSLARAHYPRPTMELFKMDTVFGNWSQAHAQHFLDGAIFDQVFTGIRP